MPLFVADRKIKLFKKKELCTKQVDKHKFIMIYIHCKIQVIAQFLGFNIQTTNDFIKIKSFCILNLYKHLVFLALEILKV